MSPIVAPHVRTLIGKSIFLFVACFGIQHGSTIAAYLLDSGVRFSRTTTDGTTWQASLAVLPRGEYYLSVGRPRAPCTALLDGRIVSSTESLLDGMRSGLLLGGGFSLSNDAEANPQSKAETLVIQCRHTEATVGVFTHDPVVTRYHSGVFLQNWRGFTETILGPSAASLLLVSLLFNRRERRSWKEGRAKSDSRLLTEMLDDWRFGAFGLLTFIYASSLAYFPRLHLSWTAGTYLHVVARNLFALGSLLLFVRSGRLGHAIIGVQIAFLLCAVFWGAISPGTLMIFYRWEYLWFPISSVALVCSALRKEPKSHGESWLHALLVAWSAVQIIDTIQIWTGFGAYSAPSLVALLSCSAAYLRDSERQRSAKIEVAAGNVLRVVESQAPIASVLKEVTNIALSETSFVRSSAYVDGFCLGVCPKPGESFYRIEESGYRKDTSKDAVVAFSEGRGQYMAEALSIGRPVLRRGSDNAWFLVIPLGKHACINLSDDRPKSAFLAYENEEIVARIHPSLRSLDRRLVEDGLRQGIALQKLRSIRGDGSWEELVGAIFVDVSDYSRYAEVYGDAFTTFISAVYLPAMTQALTGLAHPEHVAGDEIYFAVIRDLHPAELTTPQATVAALSRLDRFVIEEGSALCSQAGFPNVVCSMGVNVGQATIVADSVRVRTSGNEINHAKRLQEEAGKGNILTKVGAQLPIEGTQYALGEPFFIQKKKNVLLVQKVLRLSVAQTGSKAG